MDNAYKLLYADAIRVTHGLVNLRDLAKVLSGEIEPEHVDFLAEFLNERASCCLLPNNYYFFPDAAPANEPAALKDLLEQQPQLAISFDVPYLPLGFHARLVHTLFSGYLQSTTNIWRHGFIMQTKDTQAIVQYQLRKSRVELVLTGELAGFSELLSVFLNEFKKLVASEQIQPSVKIHKDLFSVHSTERLIKVLETIQNYDQLIEEVKAMAAKESHIHYAGDHIENKGGAGSNFATKSENFSQSSNVQYVEVSANQRQQLTLLMDELLKAQPKGKDLVTIGTVQEALESPNEPKSKSLLSKVWGGVKDVGVFTKETGIPIAEKVIEHKDTILSVVSAGIAAASSIT